MNESVPPYPTEYRHEHEGKQTQKVYVTAGTGAGGVLTEALQLEYTQF